MMKCNHDCFNCELDDCKVNTMSKKEREELKKRDFNYFNSITLIRQKPSKMRQRYSR